jgi:hypothetical protein
MIQVQDYKIKIFMEFWKGYDFLINEAVVADFAGTVRGLGDAGKCQCTILLEEVEEVI